MQVVGSAAAFAALRRDGSVVAWGGAAYGANLKEVQARLVDVRAIYASRDVFVALRGDGEVVTWGVAAAGGDSRTVGAALDAGLSHEAPGLSRDAVAPIPTPETTAVIYSLRPG